MMINYDAYATILLARDDLADLYATRDAQELTTYLINNNTDRIIADMIYYFGPEEMTILHQKLTAMVLNPND